MIVIDGSYGEGGGQILRTAASAAALTGEAIRIENIRAGRPEPGLKAQHRTAITAAMTLCGGRAEGAEIGACAVTLRPGGPVRPGNYTFDVGTAGSTMMVLQTLLVPLLRAGGESHLVLRGGTHNVHAPSTDYVRCVFLPVSELAVQVSVGRLGFYPRGGGEVNFRINATADQPPPIDRAGGRAPLRTWNLLVVASEALPPTLAERAEARLREHMGAAHAATFGGADWFAGTSLSTGVALLLLAQYGDPGERVSSRAGFTAHGRRGVPIEAIADDAWGQFLAFEASAGVVDEHLADQLILPACFAPGPSTWRTAAVTEHLRTMAWLVPQVFPGVAVDLIDDVVRVRPGTA